MDETEVARVERLITRIQKAADLVRNFPSRVRVLAHYDSDGVSSAAILSAALHREGKDFHVSFAKQLSESVIDSLLPEPHRLYLFLDFGSGMLPAIQSQLLSRDRSPSAVAIVVDHHIPQGELYSPNLIHLNPLDVGIGENISGAGMSYLLARAMRPENKDLAELAIIGAIGDSQMGSVGPDWTLFGLNKEILKDAVAAGKVRADRGLRLWGRYTRPLHKALQYSVDPYIPGVSGSQEKAIQFLQEIGIPHLKTGGFRTLADLDQDEQKKLATAIIRERIRTDIENPDYIFGDVYELLQREEYRDANEFTTLLNACGKLGNPGLGVSLCLADPGATPRVKKLLVKYRKQIGEGIQLFYKKRAELLQEREHAVYVLAGGHIQENVISNVISTVHKSHMLPDKPVFAFVHTPEGTTKLSARASEEQVEKGVNLGAILAEAARKAGGQGGGHRGAAGAAIPRGHEEMLINAVEDILQSATNAPAVLDQHVRQTPTSPDRGPRAHSHEEGRQREKVEGKGLVRYFGA